MARFEIAYKKTNAVEKMVLSNNVNDLGGATFGGIARRREPGASWIGWRLVDRGDLTSAAVLDAHRAFFRDNFWDDISGDAITDQDIANRVYDAGVNCGTDRARTWLQVALNLANLRASLWPDIRVDGDIGPATLFAITSAAGMVKRKWLVIQIINTQQESHYMRLAQADISQETFLLGWYVNRIQHAVPAWLP